jgi:hypothetical protein
MHSHATRAVVPGAQRPWSPRAPYTPPSSNGPTIIVTSTFDIYVDTHNRLVRLHSVDRQAIGTSTEQIDFSDYGIAVHVTAPPANQVYVAPK